MDPSKQEPVDDSRRVALEQDMNTVSQLIEMAIEMDDNARAIAKMVNAVPRGRIDVAAAMQAWGRLHERLLVEVQSLKTQEEESHISGEEMAAAGADPKDPETEPSDVPLHAVVESPKEEVAN